MDTIALGLRTTSETCHAQLIYIVHILHYYESLLDFQ